MKKSIFSRTVFLICFFASCLFAKKMTWHSCCRYKLVSCYWPFKKYLTLFWTLFLSPCQMLHNVIQWNSVITNSVVNDHSVNTNRILSQISHFSAQINPDIMNPGIGVRGRGGKGGGSCPPGRPKIVCFWTFLIKTVCFLVFFRQKYVLPPSLEGFCSLPEKSLRTPMNEPRL